MYAPLSKMSCNPMSYPIIILMIRILSHVSGLPILNLSIMTTNLSWNLVATFLSSNLYHCFNRLLQPIIVAVGTMNVIQDMVGDIPLGGFRWEVIICHRNILVILLPICTNIWYARILILSIALMCMSNVITPSPIFGNRESSGVWAVRPMSHANAIICHSSLPILDVKQNKSASNAPRLNPLSVAAFHVLPVYARNVTRHARLLMLLPSILPIVPSMIPMV